MVLLARLAKVQRLEDVTALPAPGVLFTLFDLHPVGLVSLLTSLTLAANVSVTHVSGHQERVLRSTRALVNGVLGVKNVDTLGLTQKLESLQTSGLVLVGGNGTGGGTLTNQRGVGTGDLGEVLSGRLVHQLLGSISRKHPGDGNLSGNSESTSKH